MSITDITFTQGETSAEIPAGAGGETIVDETFSPTMFVGIRPVTTGSSVATPRIGKVGVR
jgi:hypothetical protein